MEKMMQALMRQFRLIIALGFMMIVLSLIIGAINAGNATAYYAVDKATRETSAQWVPVRAAVESTVIWLPYFKFLGLGMILAGITMALGLIATRLRVLGTEVMGSLPQTARQPVPGKPRSATYMRLLMMSGLMVIIIGLVVAIGTAATAGAVFSNPIPVIDATPTGSALLQDLARIHANEAWLEAFKFVGVALLFLSIVSGLSTVLFSLRSQQTTLPVAVDHLPSAALSAAAAAD
jgi:hypothetical protein